MKKPNIKKRTTKYKNGKDDSVILNTIAYNKYKNNLPNNLKHEDYTYDLYGAFKAGLNPELQSDGTYHLGSRDPKTGKILKSTAHPTFSKAVYEDMKMGYYPVYKNGNIYTKNPFQYKSGKDSIWDKYSKFNDSFASIPVKFLDPTGISSWKDVYDAWTDKDLNVADALLETAGAVPLIGKIAKIGKAAKILSKDKNLFKTQDYILRGIGTSHDVQQQIKKYKGGKDGIELKPVKNWKYVDDGSGNMNIVDTNTGQVGTLAIEDPVITTRDPRKYDSSFDGSFRNLYNTTDAMTGGLFTMLPVLGDAMDAGLIADDIADKNYKSAGIGAGMFLLPNILERPLRFAKKGMQWIGDQIWLAKSLNDVGTGLKNPWIQKKWKMYRTDPSLAREYSKYTERWDNVDINDMRNSISQLKDFYNNFPGLDKINVGHSFSNNPNNFLSQATQMLNRAKYYAKGYDKILERLKSNDEVLYNIAKESPQYSQQIYNDVIKGKVKDTKNYIKSLIDQSNTFMRGMRNVDPNTNPNAYLSISGHSIGKTVPTMDVGSPNIVLEGNYGEPVIYKPKNRKLTGSMDTWWSQRYPNFEDKSIQINPKGTWTGNTKSVSNLIPGGFKNKNAVELQRILNNYLYDPKQLNLPTSYGRNASHMVFFSPNKGASISDQFDIIPAQNINLRNIRFGLGYNDGKDSGIHIKKANVGKFTKAAEQHGMGVQQFANKVLKAPKGKYSSTLRKRANFARNAKNFNH